MIGRGETDWLYVDVDGTLLIWPTVAGSPRPGERPLVNAALVDRIKAWRADSGGTIALWTMGGAAHARMARDLCGLGDETVCLAKPDLVIDDAAPDTFRRKMAVVQPDGFLWG